jgi:glycosyltransferase 2 family protein
VTTPRPAKARVARPLRLVLTALAALFVLYAGWDLRQSWDSQAIDFEWTFAILSLLPLVASAFVAARAWIALIERMAQRAVPRRFALRLYMESQLARYTPGKVGLPLVRMAGAARLGLPARAVGTSVLIEVGSWLAVGGTVGFAALALFGDHLSGTLEIMGRWAPLFVLAFVLGTLLLTTLDRRRLPSRPLRWLELDGSGPILPVELIGYHLLNWATWLIHGYLVARAVGAEHAPALGAAGLFVLAPVAGFLALAAPAGLGIREALLSLGLLPAVGAAPALSAALISRAASLISDIGSFIWARLLARREEAKPELGSPGAGS